MVIGIDYSKAIERGKLSVEKEQRTMLHVHVFIGNTSCDKDHSHLFTGTTGPEIEVAGGRHVHNFEGRTSFDHAHWHGFEGRTGLDIELPDGYHTHRMDFMTEVAIEHRHQGDTFAVASKEEEHGSLPPRGRAKYRRMR